MNKNKRHGAIAILSLAAVITLFAGCAGSGGGGDAMGSSGRGSLKVNARITQRAVGKAGAARVAAAASDYSGAAVTVFSYDSSASWTLKAEMFTPLYQSAANEYVGAFLVTDIPAGNNYTCEVFVYNSSVNAGNFENTNATPTAIVSGIVDSVWPGVLSIVVVDERTTVGAVAALRYSQLQDPPVALGNTSVVTSTVKTKIEDAVDALYDSGTLTSDIVADYFTHSGWDPLIAEDWNINATMTAVVTYVDMVLDEAGLLPATGTTDTTAPYVSKFMIDTTNIATSTTTATNVSYDGTAFKVVFNESMDTSITPSGYSIALQNATTASTLTINSSSSASYGTLAWGTTTNTNDTLTFTLNNNATLLANSLKVLVPKTTYNITSWTAPTNLKDAAGNALSTTGIVTTGSFTTIGLQASSFSPVSGATGVEYDATVFKVIFNQTMDSAINLNTQATLTASGFSVSLQSQYGGTLTINWLNALNYGAFSWTTTTKTNDTLAFTLDSSATLTTNGMKTLQPNTTYNITSRTVPTNLKDLSANSIDTTTNIATTGSFTTKQ